MLYQKSDGSEEIMNMDMEYEQRKTFCKGLLDLWYKTLFGTQNMKRCNIYERKRVLVVPLHYKKLFFSIIVLFSSTNVYKFVDQDIYLQA